MRLVPSYCFIVKLFTQELQTWDRAMTFIKDLSMFRIYYNVLETPLPA